MQDREPTLTGCAPDSRNEEAVLSKREREREPSKWCNLTQFM